MEPRPHCFSFPALSLLVCKRETAAHDGAVLRVLANNRSGNCPSANCSYRRLLLSMSTYYVPGAGLYSICA